MFGQTAFVNQLGFTAYETSITQARIVYHTTYTGNYAYLEVYNADAKALALTVRAYDTLTNNCSLYATATAGEIPSGYTDKTIVLAMNGLVATSMVDGASLVASYGNGNRGFSPFGASRFYIQPEATAVTRAYYCGPDASTFGSLDIYRATSTGSPSRVVGFGADGKTTLDGALDVSGTATFTETPILSKAIASQTGVGTGIYPIRIVNPGGAAYATTVSPVTGALKITLPQTWTSALVRFTVKIFEYTTNASFEVHCGGYTYIAGAQWINTTAYIIGAQTNRNFSVRFGHDGSKCCVYIGELASTWSYPQVFVTDVEISNATIAQWDTGWVVGFEASAFGTITATASNCQVGKYVEGNLVWHAGNDGSGSGLSADDVDGYHAASLAKTVASGTTITVGPSGRDYTTIQAALDSLKGKVLADVVTINVDAGDYAPFVHSSQPYGRNILLVGDQRHTAGTQGIATGSIARTGDNCTITLTAAPPSDFGAGDYVTVADCTTAANVGRFPVVSIDTVNFAVTYTNASGVAEAVKTGTRVIWNPNRTITNSGTWLSVGLGSDLGGIRGFTLLGISNSQGIGFSTPVTVTISRCHAYGILIGFCGFGGGMTTYDYCSAVKCTYGLYHLNGCSSMIYNANLHNCNYGLMITDGSVASNTGSTVTITGNTIGVFALLASAISLYTLKVVTDNTADYIPTPGPTGGSYGSYIQV